MNSVILWLRRILYIVFALVLLVLGYWIGAENTQLVNVSLVGFSMPALSLGTVLCIALLVGVVSGCLISLVPIFRLSNSSMSLRRKLKRRDIELARLRAVGVKE